ncbi:uncharacterized protein LOC111372665 [Olea europaea var. sylvestris]|uniref:uncharacterized protein LOC111372665 n=1 Tax=Olea europaea var. sylvestris TaxID=158386 RepID=UPI000C1D8532|nr:uncharacterized protein LOC111372665 [Olea europaea var. sylvestris]
MAEEDQEKTSFMVDSAIYCYRVMPFGLKNAGATYQRLINKIFAELIGKMIKAYVDNMVVKSKQVNGHVSDLEEVFAKLRRGIEANPDKIQALISIEAPKCKRDFQKLTGHVAALNRFVSQAADMCFSFFKLLRENQIFDWNEEYNLAFQELKQTLATPPNAVCGVLVKEKERVQQPAYYVSKVLDAKTRYTLAEQLALALVITARKLRSYFQSHPIVLAFLRGTQIRFLRAPKAKVLVIIAPIDSYENRKLVFLIHKVVRDSSLRNAFHSLVNKLYRHVSKVGESPRALPREFKSRPAIKAQALADFIAELTLRPPKTQVKDPSTTPKIWEIFVDRASNSSGSGADIIITSLNKTMEIQCALRFEFEATNNEVKYEAVIIALELAKNLELERVKVFSDSQLVVGWPELVKPKLMHYPDLSSWVWPSSIEEHSIAQKPSVMDINYEPFWMDPIVDYISNDSLPAGPQLARSIRYRAVRYCLIEGVLFRKSFTLPYLRCLKPSESLQALTEVHEGICENHERARALAYKLIRYGYYWPSLKKNVADYIRKCDKCQKFGNIMHAPTEELASIHYSAPFEQWGVDILGPFPLARGQLKFVAVAVEYFKKLVEAEPLATISEPKLRSFIWKSTICRFGIPKVLITNNGRQFDNLQFGSFVHTMELIIA